MKSGVNNHVLKAVGGSGVIPVSSPQTRVATLALAFTLLTISGCTNNLFQRGLAGSSDGVAASSPIQGSLPTGGSTSGLVLSRVIKNSLDPGGTFDLTDDLSGSMEQFCAAVGNGGGGGAGGAPAAGATTCNCEYTYTRPDGATESIEVPTIYHERDLIRCKYTNVPAGVSFVRVKIHMTNSDQRSNEVVYRFTGTGVSLDLADPNSFSLVKRFQCRDQIFLNYLFGNQIYDPIQSEDPQISYPRNFYTTNMGGSLALYTGGNAAFGIAAGIQNFNCPALPNDPAAGTDLTIYSEGPDSGGSKQIYPPQGSVFDRSTFLLARQPSGVFNVPVDSYIAPDIRSAPLNAQGQPNGSPPPLGFGATPVPGAAGQETCPDSSVTIPGGYHWVKVWLFRSDLVPRKTLTSTRLQGLNSIECLPAAPSGHTGSGAVIDPAPATPPGKKQKLFADCAADSLTFLGVSDGMPGLATRILTGLSNMCVNITPGGTTAADGRTLQTGGGANAPSTYFGPIASTLSQLPPGSDTWIWNNPDNTSSTNDPPDDTGCSATPGVAATQDPHICHAPHNSGSGVPVIPFDDDLVRTDYQPDVTNPKFDFLFVVSPPTVMVADMANSSTSTHFTYTPYRFMSPGDCNSSDPDKPSSTGDCPVRRMIRNYGLKFHDVGSNGDPPDGTSRPGVFPVCALQPD